ncbi:PilZ domain-containing protein [Allochromatium palmeri]|uniref:PilZ domain-containing protein n=1 Tax=Allochromatium palmeri TaxID=231048 RepID=A0A6N8EG77_9GAMM|nr:PilZ domain-containing protein [Allochromatium palmeri]MTW21666.1 PilZ domain-containing protein [Allochromatium palmeri]
MSIEHRYGQRRPRDIDVQIQYRNRRFRSAKGRNLSDQGMYLEVSNLTLPTGTLVVLEVRDMGREWRIPAIVIHQDSTGIGVMFRDMYPEFLAASAESFMPPMSQQPPNGHAVGPGCATA